MNQRALLVFGGDAMSLDYCFLSELLGRTGWFVKSKELLHLVPDQKKMKSMVNLSSVISLKCLSPN